MIGTNGQHELSIVMRMRDELSAEFRRVADQAKVTARDTEQSVGRNFQAIARGARAMAAGFSAITATAAAADRSLIGVGASLLGAFATGGPVGLGIAAVGTGLGIVLGHLRGQADAERRVAEEARRVNEEYRKRVEASREENRNLQLRLDLLRELGREPTNREQTIRGLRADLAALRKEAAGLVQDPDEIGSVPRFVARDQLEPGKYLPRLRALEEQIRLQEEALKLEEDATRELERQTRLRKEQSDELLDRITRYSRDRLAVSIKVGSGDLLNEDFIARELGSIPGMEETEKTASFTRDRIEALRHELAIARELNPLARERLAIERETVLALASVEASDLFESDKETVRQLVLELQKAKIAALEYGDAAGAAEERAMRRLPFEERLSDLEFENSKFGLSPEGQQLADLDRAVREEGKSIEFAALRGDIDSGLRDRLKAELAVYRDETAKFIRELGDPFVETIRGVGPQVVSALTHIGVQGFKGWEDAAKSFLLSLSGQFLNAGLTSLGKSIPFFSQFFAAQSGGVFEVGDATQFPARRFAGGGLTDYGRPEIIMVGEGAKREAVVPLPDGRSIPVQMRGGGAGGNVNINLSVNVGGGGGFLDLSPDDQIRIILSHVERGLRGRWAQAVAARVQGALI